MFKKKDAVLATRWFFVLTPKPQMPWQPLASAGADHITVQWESLGGDAESRSLAFCDFAALVRPHPHSFPDDIVQSCPGFVVGISPCASPASGR